VLDRHGARLALCLAVLVTGTTMLLLSLTQSLLVFYLLFCTARMNWAGPFDLGIYSGVSNWFCRPPRLCHLDCNRGAAGGASW